MLVLEYKIKAKPNQYKAIAVPPHNTSQECCLCNKKVHKELKERIHACDCGLVIHRDINAAINILLKAKSRDGQSRSNALGEVASTLVGAILLGQATSLIKESPGAKRQGIVNRK